MESTAHVGAHPPAATSAASPIGQTGHDQAQRIGAIQGLRGIAAGMVLLHHLPLHADRFGLELPHALVELGMSGVDIFFLISGYLIARILRGTTDYRSFVLRRLIRVVPLLWVSNVVVGAVNARLGGPVDAWTFLSSCLMLPGIVDLPAVQPYAWSLSYEFTFYLGAALTAFTWRRSRIVGAVGLAIACLAILPTNPRFVYLLVGSAVAFRRVDVPLPALALTLLFGIGTSRMFLEHGMWATLGQIGALSYLVTIPLGYLTFCAILRPGPVARRVLESAPLQQLGLISYSFYMWQNLVIVSVLAYWPWREGWSGFLPFSIVVFALVLLVSRLSYSVIEVDSARVLRRVVSR